MLSDAIARTWTSIELEERIVRHADLVPCRNAFVDSRTPGSDAKENFTIIGAGVSENPDQHVHIAEPHGFNIGGARQPPGCTNSQHSHDTAEIFVVHSGEWRFDFGEHGDDARILAGPGDVVSFPTRTFRGFRNVGRDTGFLWSVLGGDDPGRVTWAPKVFDLARAHGLVLLENGALVDTVAGQGIPADAAPMPVTSLATISGLRVMTPADEAEVLARASDMAPIGETLLIGAGGVLPAVGGFTLSRLVLAPGASAAARREVLFVQQGAILLRANGAEITLGVGDTLTMPEGIDACYHSSEGATLFVVRRS
jgi:quercetin dioxygenase-like cupin family protein